MHFQGGDAGDPDKINEILHNIKDGQRQILENCYNEEATLIQELDIGKLVIQTCYV